MKYKPMLRQVSNLICLNMFRCTLEDRMNSWIVMKSWWWKSSKRCFPLKSSAVFQPKTLVPIFYWWQNPLMKKTNHLFLFTKCLCKEKLKPAESMDYQILSSKGGFQGLWTFCVARSNSRKEISKICRYPFTGMRPLLILWWWNQS